MTVEFGITYEYYNNMEKRYSGCDAIKGQRFNVIKPEKNNEKKRKNLLTTFMQGVKIIKPH